PEWTAVDELGRNRTGARRFTSHGPPPRLAPPHYSDTVGDSPAARSRSALVSSLVSFPQCRLPLPLVPAGRPAGRRGPGRGYPTAASTGAVMRSAMGSLTGPFAGGGRRRVGCDVGSSRAPR